MKAAFLISQRGVSVGSVYSQGFHVGNGIEQSDKVGFERTPNSRYGAAQESPSFGLMEKFDE